MDEPLFAEELDGVTFTPEEWRNEVFEAGMRHVEESIDRTY